jgi:hypothetical protein
MLEWLRAPSSPPFLDRPAFERLFGVRRRQAIRLMGSCEGYQVGKTFLVDREAVIGLLSTVESSGAGEQERVRKRRVMAALEESAGQAAAKLVRVPRPRALDAAALPAGISLAAPGRLEIHYTTAEELLARVVELVTAATQDFPAFREAYERKA